MSKSVTLITPTGGRPEAFALCEKYFARQTRKFDQWIVIDDQPDTPTKCTLGQEYYTAPLLWKKGINTQRYSLAFGLSKVKGDVVAIAEDDDWIHPNYLEVYCDFLKHCAVVGECDAIYYSLPEKSYRFMRNFEHASTCQTAFRRGAIPFFERALHSGDLYFDITLWKNVLNDNIKHILFNGMKLCIGIKGMPGRPGIGVGHRPAGFKPDDGTILTKYLGLDAENYKKYLGKSVI